MTEQPIYLLGGGPRARRQTMTLLRQALGALGKSKPVAAYVGVASNDNVFFRKLIGAFLERAGARVEPVRLASRRAKASAARAVLDDADVVFVSGGDVDRGMQVLNERDMADHIRGLHLQGKPMLGISAGSIMLAREWVRFREEDEDAAEIFPCLGVAPVHVDTHSEDDDWSELRVLVKLLERRDGAAAAVGYGIPSSGCLRVRPANGAKLSAAGAPVARLVVRRGEVVHDGAVPLE